MYKVKRYYSDKPPKTTRHQTHRGAQCAFTRHRNNIKAWAREYIEDTDKIVEMWHEEESN